MTTPMETAREFVQATRRAHAWLQRLEIQGQGDHATRNAILLHLYISGPKKMRDIADAVCVQPQSLTATIDDMTAKKLVLRENSTRDRRQIIVSLTPDGEGLGARLARALHNARFSAPTIVCLCGSTRFLDAFQQAEYTEAGRIVLTIGCDTKSDQELFSGPGGDEIKAQLDELHKRKIDLADEILVLNCGGYVGPSTRSEIAYATNLGKPIRYLEPTTDANASSV